MKDCWLLAAISDDTFVAAFLLRLKHPPPPPPPSSTLPSWGLRLPRSKQPLPTSTATTTTTTTSSNVLVFEKNNSNGNKNKRRKESATHGRLSPTTPLCWAGPASSPSDDSQHSSFHVTPPSDPFRSKLDLHVETKINSEVKHSNSTINAISEAASSNVTTLVDKFDDACEPDSQKQDAISQERLFMLPDLNMAPDDIVGMS